MSSGSRPQQVGVRWPSGEGLPGRGPRRKHPSTEGHLHPTYNDVITTFYNLPPAKSNDRRFSCVLPRSNRVSEASSAALKEKRRSRRTTRCLLEYPWPLAPAEGGRGNPPDAAGRVRIQPIATRASSRQCEIGQSREGRESGFQVNVTNRWIGRLAEVYGGFGSSLLSQAVPKELHRPQHRLAEIG